MTRDTSTSSPPSQDTQPGAGLPLAYQRLLAIERFKSGFLARTSHELRSPINTIVSLHQLILEDLCEGPEEEKEFLGQSKDAALKMLALFDQITAVSKLDIGREPAKQEAVDLSFLLPEIEMLTTLQAANQNVRYTVTSPIDELEVLTDAKWLKSIVVSLIQDAIGHTKILSLETKSLETKTGDQSVALVIACDRPAEDLQNELDAIAQAAEQLPETQREAEAEEDPAKTKLSKDTIPPTQSIQLSTGLILATAHTALPLIGGAFAIAPHPDAGDRSLLTCTFPAA